MLFKDDKNLQNNVETLQIQIGNQTVEQVGTGCKENQAGLSRATLEISSEFPLISPF